MGDAFNKFLDEALADDSALPEDIQEYVRVMCLCHADFHDMHGEFLRECAAAKRQAENPVLQ
jgi:hypothetical protein